jgi:serine/threonine protein kinase/WD40 repeat protein
MSEPRKRNPVEELAESFLRRYRAGERPSLTEYVSRHPELAEEIRQLFPALIVMEEIGAAEVDAADSARRQVAPDGRQVERIGDYRIIREVGRGGMGVVYEAEQESLGRHVALKVLPFRSAGDAVRLQRFRREARSAARLHHTNIVPVYEIGEAAGIHYYAMQFIQGQSLHDVLVELRRMRGPAGPAPEVRTQADPGKEFTKSLAGGLLGGHIEAGAGGAAAAEPGGPAPAGDGRAEARSDRNGPGTRSRSELSDPSDSYYYRSVARIGLQIAEALAYAHGQRILHRDIKPSNLLLDLAGTVWITDFGLAKEEGDDLTQTGDLVGTLRYMAPERFGGRCDPRSDIYGVGLTLHELLTLEPAFRESNRQQLVNAILTREPGSPRKLDPRVPRDLETIVLKAIAKEPDRRYQTAADLAEDLRRFAGDRPILARRPLLGERFLRWCRRNPAVAALSLLVATMTVLVSAGSVVAALRLSSTAEQARRAERDTENQLFDSLLLQARAGRSSQRPGQRGEGLNAITRAARLGRARERDPGDLLRLRNEAIACLALPDLEAEADWKGNPPGTTGIGFDAAFERYAWSFQDQGIRVRRLADHAELFRLPTPPSDRVSRWVLLSFSPDGRYLAAYYVQWAREHPLEVWDLRDGASRRVVAVPDAAALPAFASDGRSLVAPLPDGEVAVVDLPSGREQRRLPSGGPADAVALQPGGQLLAVAGGQTDGVRVLDLVRGSVIQRLPHPDEVQGLAWSADGKMLATSCNDLRIRIWDTVRWQKEGELTGHRYEVGELAFDTTGKWLASFGWDMTLRVWDVAARQQVLKVDDIRVLGFRSRGGLGAAGVTGRRVQVWGLRPSEVFQELRPFPTDCPNISFSPDGRWLLTMRWPMHAREGWETRVWEPGTLREVHHSLGSPRSWSPDWTWLLSFEADGLARLPVVIRPGTNGEFPGSQLGKPRPLTGLREDVRGHFFVWVGPEGRRLLLVEQTNGHTLRSRIRLLDLQGESIRVLWEDSMLNANFPVSSPDGRLVAVSSYWGGNGISVWETDTGRLVRELPIGDARMAFAADGRRLYTITGRLSPRGAECRSWRLDSWQADRAVPLQRASHAPAGLTVASDGTVAVIATASDVRLLEPDTLDEIVTLSAPRPEVIQGSVFSPDATTLATSASGIVQMWNLRQLHKELAVLGLDSRPGSQPPQSAVSSGR